MFLHLLKYRLKIFIKPSDEIFWCIAFPFILGTLFYLAFGNTMEDFKPVPVAVVTESNADTTAATFLHSIDASSDHPLLDIKNASKEEGNSLLQKEDVLGIITVTDTLSLKVNHDGLEESIVKSILDQYLSTASTIQTIAAKNPADVPAAIKRLTDQTDSNQEITLNKHKNNDYMTSYFYALIAMSCLFHCFLGFKAMTSTQANLTALAARRSVTPTHKMTLILSDFVACLCVGYLSVCVLILYLSFVLHINFGDRLPFVFLIAFFGSIIGITFGIFISSIGKWSITIKESFLVSSSMILCFLSGLMFNNMLNIVEHNCPILNRINPAALISDAIYCLSIYDSYERFLMDLGLLIAISILLIIGSFLLTRRERYASI